MSKYSQAVLAVKPEFSYLNTDAPLRETYSDGTVTPYNPRLFPYAEAFMQTLLKRVDDTYAAIVEPENRKLLCEELSAQLRHDFRFDFSDHLGPMRQRDKRGAEADVENNDYNMFHSCYKFVNQAARAHSFNEKFNLSLMSGRVNTDNQTGPEICDPFVFGPPMYLYSKNYPKVIAMTLPGYDSDAKISQLKAHEKEIKKDMIAKKSQAVKLVKARWHDLINRKFLPQGVEFKDLSLDTVKAVSDLHKELLAEVSTMFEKQLHKDVKMLGKIMKLLSKQNNYHQKHKTPDEDLGSIQLASVHAMQANELLENSSVIQVSIEAEKPIYRMMADILDNPDSLTAKIFNNPHTRKVFETEMKAIHTTKSDSKYTHLLDKMENTGSKMPDYAKVVGEEYDAPLSAAEMAAEIRRGKAMPKVSFMLAVLLMETGAKIEGGSSQIVYAEKIRQSMSKVFAEAAKHPEFDKKDLRQRFDVINKFNYRTAQAQIWGVKENGNVLGYRDLLTGTVKIDDSLLNSVASVKSSAAFEAAAIHRFYTFTAHREMSPEESILQKSRIKNDILNFEAVDDCDRILRKGSPFYDKLKTIINNDENVRRSRTFITFQRMAQFSGRV